MSDPQESLYSFVANPNAQYTIISQHASPYTQLCRQDGDKGRQCITLKMYSTQMFEAMQKHGFFCALPSDPSRTQLVCKKLPPK